MTLELDFAYSIQLNETEAEKKVPTTMLPLYEEKLGEIILT